MRASPHLLDTTTDDHQYKTCETFLRYLTPARFYVTHFETVAVEHVRRPTPAGEGRRCLLVFNDVVFVCKASPGVCVNKSEL